MRKYSLLKYDRPFFEWSEQNLLAFDVNHVAQKFFKGLDDKNPSWPQQVKGCQNRKRTSL